MGARWSKFFPSLFQQLSALVPDLSTAARMVHDRHRFYLGFCFGLVTACSLSVLSSLNFLKPAIYGIENIKHFLGVFPG